MALIEVAVRCAFVLLVAWLATLAMQRSAAATRHLVWTLAVTGALVVPLAVASLPAWRVLPEPGRADVLLSYFGAQPTQSSSELAPPDRAVHASSPDARETVPRTSARTRNAQRSLTFHATVTWALVACVLLVRMAAGARAVRRLTRHAKPADTRWRALLRELQPPSRVRSGVKLLVAAEIAVPMTWGARKPVILLPSAALGWSDDCARIVLLHELAHIRRMDGLTQALARALAALHWFNPLSWVACRALAHERERACDDFVLAHGAQPESYAQHLLDIARAGISGPTYALAPAMARPSELEGRLLSILTPRRRDPRRGASILCAAGAAAITVAAASAAPRFDPPTSNPPALVTRTAAPRATAWIVQQDDTPQEKRNARRTRAALQPLAEAATGSENEDTREKATMALALRSEPDVVEPLIRALRDPSGQVREKAAIGLAFRRDPRAVAALLDAMTDRDSQVREKAVVALGLSGDDRAVDALTRALDDPDAQVREKAAGGLALLGSPLSRVLAGPAGAGGALADAIRDGVAGAIEPYLQRPR